MIVSSDGFILTNNHVVTGEARRVTIEQLDVTVALADKREMRADVVGVDPATDLAVLKIGAKDLPTIPWGDSSRLKVAEWVLAVGNPYQLSQTVTLGIVSAVGRTNLGVSTYEDFIQTDAAINPGNSGGALVNARGELVGINTVIFSQSGGYQGIGFAVSSNLARRVVNDLQQYQEVRRGSMGPDQYGPLSTRMAEEIGAPDTRGRSSTGCTGPHPHIKVACALAMSSCLQWHARRRSQPSITARVGRADRQHGRGDRDSRWETRDAEDSNRPRSTQQLADYIGCRDVA